MITTASGGAPREVAFGVAVWVTYAALLALLGWHHEPWRDEADNWLVARDNGAGGLLRLARYQGTPALWFFVLSPLAKLGAPYWTMRLLNSLFLLAAVGLVLRRAPFSRLTLALLPFSYLLSYEYGVIARSYGMSVLLLFAVAALDPQRSERRWLYWGLVGLLFHTNAQGGILAGAILLVGWIEALRARAAVQIGALAVASALALAALLQVWPVPADRQVLILPASWSVGIVGESLRQALFWGREGWLWTALALGVPLLCAAALAALRAWRSVLVLTFSYAGLFWLEVSVYPGSIRHWGFLFLALVFALWIGSSESGGGARSPALGARGSVALPRLALGAFTALLAVNVAGATASWVREVRHPYSMSLEVAKVLAERGWLAEDIAGHPAHTASAIVPYLERRAIFYPGIDADGSHMQWDRRYSDGLFAPLALVLERIRERFPGGDPLIVMSPRVRHPELQLVYEASDPQTAVRNEQFALFRLARRGATPR